MNTVQRIEEWIIRLNPVLAFGKLFVLIEFVKAFHGQSIDQRHIERHGQRQMFLKRLTSQRRVLVMIAARENAATERIATNQHIYPGDRIFKVLVRFSRKLKELFQRGKTDIIGVNIGIDNPLEPELSPEDHAGQAQSADSSREEFRI